MLNRKLIAVSTQANASHDIRHLRDRTKRPVEIGCVDNEMNLFFLFCSITFHGLVTALGA